MSFQMPDMEKLPDASDFQAIQSTLELVASGQAVLLDGDRRHVSSDPESGGDYVESVPVPVNREAAGRVAYLLGKLIRQWGFAIAAQEASGDRGPTG